MARSRRPYVVLAALASAAVLAGCTSGPTTSAESVPPETPEASTPPLYNIDVDPASWTSGSSTSGYSVALNYTNEDGYAYTVLYKPGGTEVSSSVLDSKPGYANVSSVSHVTTVTTNLSDSRKAPWYTPDIVPFYTTATVCESGFDGLDSLTSAPPDNTPTGACMLTPGNINRTYASSGDIRVKTNLAPSEVGTESYDQLASGEMSEDKANLLVDALALPDGYVVTDDGYAGCVGRGTEVLYASKPIADCENVLSVVSVPADVPSASIDELVAAALSGPESLSSCPFGEPGEYATVPDAAGKTFTTQVIESSGRVFLNCMSSGALSINALALDGEAPTAVLGSPDGKTEFSEPVGLAGGHVMVRGNDGSLSGVWFDDEVAISAANFDEQVSTPDAVAAWFASKLPQLLAADLSN